MSDTQAKIALALGSVALIGVLVSFVVMMTVTDSRSDIDDLDSRLAKFEEAFTIEDNKVTVEREQVDPGESKLTLGKIVSDGTEKHIAMSMPTYTMPEGHVVGADAPLPDPEYNERKLFYLRHLPGYSYKADASATASTVVPEDISVAEEVEESTST